MTRRFLHSLTIAMLALMLPAAAQAAENGGNSFNDTMSISASALSAQNARMRVIAENIANANTTPSSPAEKPYQRQIVTFRNQFDRNAGVNKVKVTGVVKDKTPFLKRFDPSNPGADAQGYVQTPNVQPLVETMDMRTSQRNYDANITVIEATRGMMGRTMDLLK